MRFKTLCINETYDVKLMQKIIQAVIDDTQIHALLFMVVYGTANKDAVKATSQILIQAAQKIPVATCFSAPFHLWDRDVAALEQNGVLNYPSPERAGRVLINLYRYSAIRDRA